MTTSAHTAGVEAQRQIDTAQPRAVQRAGTLRQHEGRHGQRPAVHAGRQAGKWWHTACCRHAGTCTPEATAAQHALRSPANSRLLSHAQAQASKQAYPRLSRSC